MTQEAGLSRGLPPLGLTWEDRTRKVGKGSTGKERYGSPVSRGKLLEGGRKQGHCETDWA
jgi:hypothetical protein